MMVFEREAEVVYFSIPYSMSLPAVGKCEVEKIKEQYSLANTDI